MTGETVNDRVTPRSWSDEDEEEMRGGDPSESWVFLRRRPVAECSVQKQTVYTETLVGWVGVFGRHEIQVLTNVAGSAILSFERT